MTIVVNNMKMDINLVQTNVQQLKRGTLLRYDQ